MRPTDQELRRAAKAIRDHISEDLLGSIAHPYSPFVQMGTMRPSFRPIMPGLRIITNDYVTQKKSRSRQKQESFWAKLWRLLWDHNPWPYSLIEYYEVDEPAMVFDKPNNTVICHPAIEREIKKRLATKIKR
jgi:hypothetical protein